MKWDRTKSDRPARSGRLSGRRVLVTGASRGIGAAVARACAEAGAGVALTARSGTALGELASQLRSLGAKAEAFPADVVDGPSVRRAVAAARDFLGGLDSAVINQGLNVITPIELMRDAEWERVVGTNLTGSFRIARAVVPLLELPGAVVFVSSVSGLPGHRKFPGFAAYCASKRGVLGLAEVMAVEMEERSVRVYSVCPRGVDTAMFRQTFPGLAADLTPAQVASHIVDLLDPLTAPPSGAVVEL